MASRLLSFVVAADVAAVSLLADGVDLVDEHDAGGLLLRLLEQVAHLGRAHADEHLYEFGTAHGEERHVRLARDRLGQHGLAGARRTDEQHALGHGSADLTVFGRIAQVIHDLLQIVFGFVHALHVGEVDAVRGLDVDLGVALTHVEDHGTGATGLVHQALGQELSQHQEDEDRQDPGEDEARQRRRLLDDLAREFRTGFVQTLRQPRVVHDAGAVEQRTVLVREQDHVAAHFDLADLAVFRHGHEGAVVHLFDLLLGHGRDHEHVEQQHQDQHDDIEDQNGSFRLFDFVHMQCSLLFGRNL